ncbi:hypothetical protein J6590_011210 [Homalodisca vitripennis]|nr:hypothetical protein J6590_011210 [Homalodisca vitripennis]
MYLVARAACRYRPCHHTLNQLHLISRYSNALFIYTGCCRRIDSGDVPGRTCYLPLPSLSPHTEPTVGTRSLDAATRSLFTRAAAGGSIAAVYLFARAACRYRPCHPIQNQLYATDH